MTFKRCLCALVVLAILRSTVAIPAQQLYQPTGQSGQNAWVVEPLPRIGNETFQSEPVENGFDPQHALATHLQAPSTAPHQNLEPLPAATSTTPSESSTTILDDTNIDESEAIDLAVAPTLTHTSGMCDFWGYRYGRSSMDWIVGNGNQFGMFTLNSDHYQKAGIESGLGLGIDINWVSGPSVTEMPPRLYDFSIAYQCRKQYGIFAFDVAASVMASSNFEGSAREGIRYPAHAVGYLQYNPTSQLVFGVDYLDRGDIKLLPVTGIVWIPNEDVRLELVFPRPRATFALPMFWPVSYLREDCHLIASDIPKDRRLYIGGELGGGTWAVERAGIGDDLATYRDLRLNIGIERVGSDGSRSAFEISYLFARRLEFTSGEGNMPLDDTAMISWITSY